MRDREHDHELGRSRRGSSPLRGREGESDRPDVETQVEALAAQVRDLGERLAAEAGAPTAAAPPPNPAAAAPSTPGVLGANLGERVLAAATAVAEEIRASAQREAERIRSGRVLRPGELRAALSRQRSGLAELLSATAHIEQSLEIVRARLGVLDSDRAALEETLRAHGVLDDA